MHALKRIYLTVLESIKQAWLLPQSVSTALRERRRKIVRDDLEAERLDRIRNPSRYRGR
jgi:hypothetical protein